jgi:hypothetical protein
LSVCVKVIPGNHSSLLKRFDDYIIIKRESAFNHFLKNSFLIMDETRIKNFYTCKTLMNIGLWNFFRLDICIDYQLY